MAPSLAQLIGRIGRPRRDTGRARRVFREFDEERGFLAYHERCKAAFARQPPPRAPAPLADRGFEYLDIVPAAQAAELLARLTEEHPVSSVKKGNDALVGFQGIDDEFRHAILESVLTPAVDERIAGFFASEYLVLWMIATATGAAAADEIVSFKWHCDRGPTYHLKLLVYLNASDQHGGNTEFIPLPDSRLIAGQGYVFGSTRRRTNDVGRLSALAGKRVATVMQPIPAGGGVLFQPGSVLHRGVAPDRGTRYAVTLCLLPSPVNWRAALDKGALIDLANDEKWPSHAGDLERALAG